MAGKAILHFAPERRLWPKIKAAGPARYVRCDLSPTSDEILRVDLLDMPFEAGSFDLVIANHVLEHVVDDGKAIAEIRRVLRPGGHAILQTPFSPKLERTWEDSGVDSAAARTQAFGQGDHVRLYGRDIFERIAAAGLVPKVSPHDELLADFDGDRFGINTAEPFFLFQRER